MMTAEQRLEVIVAAGYNVANLRALDVDIDLVTDAFSSERSSGGITSAHLGRETPDLQSIASSVFGPARYTAMSKGRSAELALMAAFLEPGTTVLTHGLFRTTELGIERNGGTIEYAPRSRVAGACGLDASWLGDRLGRLGSRRHVVYVEPANNGLGGPALELAHLIAISDVCRRAGVPLVMDATRLLSNCALSTGPILSAAREHLARADAFTISCGKEFPMPYGALVAVRTLELQRKVVAWAFDTGVLLEPERGQELALQLSDAEARVERIRERKRRVQGLADQLRALRVPILLPVGAHAVFVEIDRAFVEDDPARARALEALLFVLGGVRATVSYYARLDAYLLRLAVPIDAYSEEQLDGVATSIRALLDRAADAPRLTEEGDAIHKVFSRYKADEPMCLPT